MNILQYYLEQQKISIWYKKFQSTSVNQSGKTFSYINTNFRFILSFLVQFNKFLPKVGRDRKEWNDSLPGGQEADKHRIINLLQAGFIRKEESYYYISPKGVAVVDLIESGLSDREKWILLYLLLLDYKSLDGKLEIINTVKEIFSHLDSHHITRKWIVDNILLNIHTNKKNKFFSEDIFWLISFAKDGQFVEVFTNGSNDEKNDLKEYVIECSKNKNSKDLIAHKFVSSGAYSGSMLNDDFKVIYFTTIVLDTYKKCFDDFIDSIINQYCSVFQLAKNNDIEKFIYNHKSIFIRVKQNILEGVD